MLYEVITSSTIDPRTISSQADAEAYYNSIKPKPTTPANTQPTKSTPILNSINTKTLLPNPSSTYKPNHSIKKPSYNFV